MSFFPQHLPPLQVQVVAKVGCALRPLSGMLRVETVPGSCIRGLVVFPDSADADAAATWGSAQGKEAPRRHAAGPSTLGECYRDSDGTGRRRLGCPTRNRWGSNYSRRVRPRPGIVAAGTPAGATVAQSHAPLGSPRSGRRAVVGPRVDGSSPEGHGTWAVIRSELPPAVRFKFKLERTTAHLQANYRPHFRVRTGVWKAAGRACTG
jgi:hypothetical protein